MSETEATSVANRLGDLRIGVRNDLTVTRHIVQGTATYIVHDSVRFASHQLDADDYQVFVSLTTNQPLKLVFEKLVTQCVLQKDQEEDFYNFVIYLNQLGLLDLPVCDGGSLYQRFQERERARTRWNLTSLLFLRVPLIHPDAFLQRTMRFAAPLFTRTALLLWSLCALFCLWLIGVCWREFTDPLSSMITTANLPLLWCLLIGLKVIHEFGHAYACKRFGGTVPEMGAFFLLMTPCAYVDASAAWSFRRRRHRIVVSLAGIYVESMVAMAALLFWFFAANSPWRPVAHYAFVLSSLVTVGFNINPLMRYDGYYVLADLVNMPNLRRESARELSSLAKRLLYGLSTQSTDHGFKTRAWLVLFGVASSAYRLLVILGIMTFVILRFPFLGSTIALTCIAIALATKAKSLYFFVLHSEELSQHRVRGILVTTSGLALAFVLLFAIPIPRTTRAFGILERSDDVVLRAASAGFLTPADRLDGEAVARNEIVCQLSNDDLENKVVSQRAHVDILKIDSLEAIRADVKVANIFERRRTEALEELARLEDMKHKLVVRSPLSGRLVETWRLRVAGRYFHKGQPLARVTNGRWILKVVASEADYSRARLQVGQAIKLRLAGGGMSKLAGKIVSISGSASARVGDRRLTHLAGGPIPVEADTMLAQTPYFEVKVELNGDLPEGALHGMSGIALLPCEPERIGADIYRMVLRFFYRIRQAA